MMVGSSLVTLKGLWLAKIWIVAPVLIALILMLIFGEGDYIVPVLAILWTTTFFIGNRIRVRNEPGTLQRSAGFHTSFWSFWLALLCFAMTIVLIAENDWRRCPPRDTNCTLRRDL
ncbi:hypothetical protein ACFFF7_03705 [Novosphingobium aquiterrae]|uniref:Uncharacterized protein n=1 Tax=Novosphingobium aquiterrae TaxID=624388 RepID=A0ABV6PFA2_9SPHN